MYAKVILLGRLGQNADLKYTQAGLPVANFSVATDRYAGKEKGKVTTWLRVTLWGKQAESLQPYLHKGALVLVEGDLAENIWTDKEGAQRKTMQVNAREVRLAGSRGSKPEDDTAAEEGGQGGYPEDDIQF